MINEQQLTRLRNAKERRDWEVFHSEYDEIIFERLRELDPEFMEAMEKEAEGATFWYA